MDAAEAKTRVHHLLAMTRGDLSAPDRKNEAASAALAACLLITKYDLIVTDQLVIFPLADAPARERPRSNAGARRRQKAEADRSLRDIVSDAGGEAVSSLLKNALRGF